MLKKSQLILLGAISLPVLVIGNEANATGITSQEYKEMHRPGTEGGSVRDRIKAIEEAEKKRKEEAATKPTPSRRWQRPAAPRAEDQKIKQIEKNIVEARELVKELEKSGGSAALDKMKADLEKEQIPAAQAEAIVGTLNGNKVEEKLPEVNVPRSLKFETTEEEHIVTTLPDPRKTESGEEPMKQSTQPAPKKLSSAGMAPPSPSTSSSSTARKPVSNLSRDDYKKMNAPTSSREELLEAIRKRRID
jgi:hypothetical protein